MNDAPERARRGRGVLRAGHGVSAGLCLALACAGCKETQSSDAGSGELDAALPPAVDAFIPPHDSGPPPPPFEPASPPDTIAAYNELDASPVSADSGADRDAGSPPIAPPSDCLLVERGATTTLEAVLEADRRWLRVDPSDGCPASLVTAESVAYASYALCPTAEDRSLTLSMRGADMLPAPRSLTVADPMLVVYADEALLEVDPFDCLAANDDGVFDGVPSDSARIEGLALPAGARAVVLATSFEQPEQHGVGAFELEISAE